MVTRDQLLALASGAATVQEVLASQPKRGRPRTATGHRHIATGERRGRRRTGGKAHSLAGKVRKWHFLLDQANPDLVELAALQEQIAAALSAKDNRVFVDDPDECGKWVRVNGEWKHGIRIRQRPIPRDVVEGYRIWKRDI